MDLTLRLLPNRLAVCRLASNAGFPSWLGQGDFRSVTWTRDELSVVCDESAVPEGVRCEPGWRCFMVEGPLDFHLTGVLSSIVDPLARAGISIFALSTFDTDYVLVRGEDTKKAIAVLTNKGHSIQTGPGDA